MSYNFDEAIQTKLHTKFCCRIICGAVGDLAFDKSGNVWNISEHTKLINVKATGMTLTADGREFVLSYLDYDLHADPNDNITPKERWWLENS